MEGYRLVWNKSLISLWSAPNYCYRCGNIGAILEVDVKFMPKFKCFEAVAVKKNFEIILKIGINERSW